MCVLSLSLRGPCIHLAVKTPVGTATVAGVHDKVLYFRVDGDEGARPGGGKMLRSLRYFHRKGFSLVKSVFEDAIKNQVKGAYV
jgi:hypothetical protein